MRIHLLYTLFFALCAFETIGQSKQIITVETEPGMAKLVYSDIDNFWIAFDKTFSNYNGNAFNDEYIKNGSDGVRNFMDNERIVSADTLKSFVLANKSKYEAVRRNTVSLSSTEKQIRSVYHTFKNLFPQSKFPPVYFVIGRFNTGGTATPAYQIIGAEMNEPNNITHIVAHELIHSNQNIPYKYKILLEQCIIEGSADFLGELISGKIANTAAYEYAKGREKFLWDDFVKDQNLGEDDSFSNWLYGGERKDKRPQDVGYYIGYVITKAFYEKATDKQLAINEILNISDCKEFLSKSSYAPSLAKTN